MLVEDGPNGLEAQRTHELFLDIGSKRMHSFDPTPSTSSNCKVRPWAGVRDRDAEDRPRHLRYTITGMGFRFQKPESEATQGIMRKDVDA